MACSMAPSSAAGSLRPQGCRIGFYTGAGIGVNLSDKSYVLLSYEHMSNADLCPANYGLSNMGLRVGVTARLMRGRSGRHTRGGGTICRLAQRRAPPA